MSAKKNFAVVDFDDAIKQIEQARIERDAAVLKGECDLRESRLVILGYLRGALGHKDETLRSRIEELRDMLEEMLGVSL